MSVRTGCHSNFYIEEVVGLVARCALLEKLSIFPPPFGCDTPAAGVEVLECLADNCPRLHTVGYIDESTTESVVNLARNCPHLTKVSVGGLTDDGLRALIDNCSSLTHLKMGGETLVTQPGLAYALDNGRNLKTFDLAQTSIPFFDTDLWDWFEEQCAERDIDPGTVREDY